MNLCVITSVIYTQLPSIYDAKTRLKQLCKTIETVKEHIPEVYIVVIEGSHITDEEYKYLQDHDVNCIYKKNVIGLEKSIGEATLLQSYFTSDTFKSIRPKIKTISKISGRYELTEAFDFTAYDIRSSVIKHYGSVYDTRYYRFHIDNADYFIKKINDVLNSVQYMDIEHAFYQHQIFPKETLAHPEHLGVCGYNAPLGYLQVD